MIYASIDVSLQGHPRAVKAGPAMYLWTYAMLWSRSQKESGVVPKCILLASPWGRDKDNTAALEKLIEVGLFIDTGDDIQILNYAKKNDTREVIEKRINEASERKAAYRQQKKAMSHGTTNGTPSNVPPLSHGTNAGLTKESHGTPDSDADADADADADVKILDPKSNEHASEKPSEQRYREAYERGVLRGKGEGATFSFDERARGALHQALRDHGRREGKPLRGADLDAWIESSAARFAESVSSEARFYSAFQPTGWLKWLNEGGAKRAASGTYRNGRVPLQQPGPDGPLWKSEVEF
jgi:hypothetical protein